MSAKTFDTAQYTFAHGAEPRGRGNWAFAGRAAVRAANGAGEQPEGIIWMENVTYGAAKRLMPAGDWIALP